MGCSSLARCKSHSHRRIAPTHLWRTPGYLPWWSITCEIKIFDLTQNRPGLPYDVAALVSDLDSSSTTLELVNTSSVVEKTLIVQAGAFLEHKFTEIQDINTKDKIYSINSRKLKLFSSLADMSG